MVRFMNVGVAVGAIAACALLAVVSTATIVDATSSGYARHPAVVYQTHAGTRELLNVYEGKNTVLYSPYNYLKDEYSGILRHLDSWNWRTIC